MALHPLRLRRALTAVTSLQRSLSASYSTVRGISVPQFQSPISDLTPSNPVSKSHFAIFQSRSFRSSALLSSNYKLYREGDEITENTVLFEGCDFNHWLITVDFPRDPAQKPPPEEMVRTYEQICAKGLGISIEEAKKRIYACSTTTYEGFQAVMTEEQSRAFEDIPGVVFVLPDSYIDPQNKEYGGDKYENGVITHRPPPVQYHRNNRDRPRGAYPNQQRNPPYNQQGQMQGGGRNFAPQQNFQPQQNRNPQLPMNNAPGRDPVPPYQGNYNQGGSGNYNPQGQERRNFPQGQSGHYAPPQGGNYNAGPNPSYVQNQNYPGQGTGQGGQTYGQAAPQGPGQGYVPGNVGQGAPNYTGQGNTGQVPPNYGQGNPGQVPPNYGQGNPGQGAPNYTGQGNTVQGAPNYGHGNPGQGVGPRYPQGDQRNVQGVQPVVPWGNQG